MWGWNASLYRKTWEYAKQKTMHEKQGEVVDNTGNYLSPIKFAKLYVTGKPLFDFVWRHISEWNRKKELN